MRAIIRRFDAFLARQYGVFSFTDDPDCVMRLQLTVTPHRLDFPGQTVHAGEPALVIHLWNDRIPPVSKGGLDLGWVKAFQRRFLKSLRLVGRYMQDAGLKDVRALGGMTVLMFAGGRSSGERFMERLGFKVMAYESHLGRFGEFWENFYSYMLMWTYNPSSVKYRNLFRQRRAEFWIPAESFLERYGGEPTNQQLMSHLKNHGDTEFTENFIKKH